MRQNLRFGVLLTCLVVGLAVTGCRGKFRRIQHRRAHSTAATTKRVPRINEVDISGKAVDLAKFTEVRTRTLAALKASSDVHAKPADSLVALVDAWEQAPEGTIVVLEMARAAARAGDTRRLERFLEVAAPLVAGQPNLSKVLDKIALKRKMPPQLTHSPLRRIEGVTSLKDICAWIRQSFAEGRPPVANVGPQGSDTVECQALPPYTLSPEVQALPVVAAARGQGQRTFGWIASKWRNSVWLTPTLVESFAAPVHPYGNGFTIELQRTSVFRDGMPELAALITEHRAVVDPGLNEKREVERHETVVITFDLDPPQASAPVMLHSKVSVSLVDPNDTTMPKGYVHSPNLGQTSETTYNLSWGNNRAILAPTDPNAKLVEQMLFFE